MFSKPHGQRQVRGAGSADIDGGGTAAWVVSEDGGGGGGDGRHRLGRFAADLARSSELARPTAA